jgi:3-phosphoshikimate 1-carboxyvinyltransferase
VAAVAATVPGRVRITGGRLTQNHKSPRIDAIAAELAQAGVGVQVLTDRTGFVDGLEITGADAHAGGVEFSDHGDHRILMALALFSLACRNPCLFSGVWDTEDSFPDFLDCLCLE